MLPGELGRGSRSSLQRWCRPRWIGPPAACLALLAGPGIAHARLTWNGPVVRDTAGSGPALTSVACPSASECVAIDVNGGAVTFDPTAPAPQTPTTIDTAVVTGLACLSATQCVAVDVNGAAVTFDPGHPGGATTTEIDPVQSLSAVSCAPGGSTCTAVDYGGDEVDFQPGAPAGVVKTAPVDPSRALTAVSCPAQGSAAQPMCAAIDTAGNEIQFDPATGSTQSASSVGGTGGGAATLTAVSCADPATCLVFDSGGTATIQSSTGSSSTTVDYGHSIFGADCVSDTQCTLIDDAGAEVTFVPRGSSGSRHVIDGGNQLLAMACPTSNLCTAVDSAGYAVSFAPQSPGSAVKTRIDGVPAFSAVSCPAATQCTGADESGDEVTFDPASRAVLSSAAIDPGRALYAVACPSASQCTAVDQKGDEVTFTPGAPGGATPVALVNNHALLAIACPAATQCTAVDDDQYAVTFNPQSPTTARYALLGTPPGVSITGVACPSLSQCTAVDGSGEQVTFDPQNPGRLTPTAVLGGTGAVGVACPSTDQCTTLGISGTRATFDPLAPAVVSQTALEQGRLAALACPSSTYCLAVDAAGRTLEFDPHGTGATAIVAIDTGVPLTGVACRSAGDCVAVDSRGRGFAGSAVIPAPPVDTGPPRITGRARQGSTLHETHGRWSDSPTSYAVQWVRCGPGRACRPIPGATSASYRLGPLDAGRTIEVLERTANPGGVSATVASARTPRVIGAPAAPAFSSVSLSGVGSGRPRLTLTLTADRWGPRLSTVTIVLPRGLAIRLPSAGVSLRAAARGVRFGLQAAGRLVTIRPSRPITRIRVTMAFPALTAGRALVRAARRHEATKLTMTAGVPAVRHRKLQVIYRFQAHF